MSEFDTSDYERLLCDFVERRSSADEHAAQFFKRCQQEGRIDIPETVFLVLDRHQATCDMFTQDADLLADANGLYVDEAGLRRGAAEALVRLRSLDS
ncbi:hypothetical protein LZ016_00160 [Sphingomonas sp. SM33]|uniref:Colicin D immunity protein domain-containing protein n=1 Tax=Sphingomonas telluris TaxID=2907998 RepID=A0ABS9VIL5_9SPHN|nr:colicin immunity domain-containing protein [Sphingomonas telluris]MCH8614523.1 hypothetical protein [Sphingomonas telluris]